MHENDPDTILALLDGSLEASRARAVEAHMAECEACSTELGTQRIALEALQGAPRAYLTAAESADLHQTLHRRLGLAPSPAPRVAGSRRPSRLTVLVGAAVVLIGVLAVAPRLSFFGSDEADSVALASRDQAQDETMQPQAVAGENDAADATTIAAAGLGDGASPEQPTRSNLYAANAPDLDVIREAVIAAGGDSTKVTREFEDDGAPPPILGEAPAEAYDRPDTCVDAGLAELPDTVDAFVVTGAVTSEGEIVVVAYVPADVNDTVVLSHLVPSCTVVDRSP